MIVVSGGTGLIGSAVARELVRRGAEVAVVGRDSGRIKRVFQQRTVDARQADVRNTAALRAAFEGAECVINAVQFPNSPIEEERKGWTFEEIDYHGTVHQVEAAKDAGVSRFMYVSGVGASPDAAKHWFRFKWLAEEAVRGSGMPYVVVRPTWVYGPGDVALNRFIGLARRLPVIPMIGDGKQLMQPIFVDDIARIVADAVEEPGATNRVFDAGGPEMLPLNTVIRTALEVADLKRPLLHQPVWLGKLAAGLLQFAPGRPLTPDAIDFITHEATADNSALERVFAPALTRLRDGLSSYLTRA